MPRSHRVWSRHSGLTFLFHLISELMQKTSAGSESRVHVCVWCKHQPLLFVVSFQDGCYKNCPAKTYSVEEEMTCVPCDDNCVSCDEHECYWCESDLFLLGNLPSLGKTWSYTQRIFFAHINTETIILHKMQLKSIKSNSLFIQIIIHTGKYAQYKLNAYKSIYNLHFIRPDSIKCNIFTL